MKELVEKNAHMPNRVIINEKGDSTSKELASEEHDTDVHVIFFRTDGWSLGAPDELESVAYEMWKDSWVKFARSPQFIPKNMTEYVYD